MSNIAQSQFMREVADEFKRRYQGPTVTDDSDGELWIECVNAKPSRLRSPLTFGITDDSITVAFDGVTTPTLVRPPVKDAVHARQEAFALFEDLVSDRRVAISFWQGDECVGVELIPADEIQSRLSAWRGYAARVRSWSGRYDNESRG
jgi:hypothetical protein